VIIPSIDIMNGRAVQLKRGRDLVLDGGDPLDRLEQFAVAGEVAVVDLDAALGRGSNRSLIERMVRRAPCTLLAELPRERVIAAVDAEQGRVVVNGWRTRTGRDVLAAVAELAPYVGGFLLTQVEHEGAMSGFDRALVETVVAAAGGVRITAAGGIVSAHDIRWLDALGADAQVGMALYTDRLTLGDAVAAPLKRTPGDLWPTVVCDEAGTALGLVWSSPESLRRATAERRGIYWSRSRGAVWVKGATSGNTQELLRVDLDCDRDALRFVVRQHGSGFCHRGSRSCWGADFDLGVLERTIAARREDGAGGSNTARLLRDPALLAAKLREEAGELAEAQTREETVEETADLLYFALTKLVASGAGLHDVRTVLERRALRVTRRPMEAKT
jgi:phosphoribosyl-ATP pyrophosphohydrolase/phosphoribosyl-AMP cyclohydrolase